MKKLLVVLLCCLLLVPAALATEMEETPAISMEEMEMFKESLLKKALDGAVTVQEDKDGLYTAITSVGDLTISGENLTADTHVQNVRLSVEQAGPRGLKVGDSLEMLFQVYPNDNPALLGSYYEATLCIYDEQDETMLGYALRNGQRVTEVTYAVYSQQSDGIVKSGITFLLDQGYIQQINLFTAPDMMTKEEMQSEISDSALVQESEEYFAYPSSQVGTDLDPFCREDLVFSGLDFCTMTVEDAIRVLGSANVDEWNQDTDKTWLRLLQWDGVTLVAKYDANKKLTGIYSLSITNEDMEGPRGLRAGDYLDTVIFRFRHSEGTNAENGVILYGDGEKAPFGKITYSEDTDTIIYADQLDQNTVMLYLTFRNDILTEIQLFLNK